ncbi:MAG: HXXEE domain-containing protein [Candidatus Peregrinibacteria bacterium]
MVSFRLRLLFLVAAFLFVLHGVEECLTDFTHVDSVFRLVFVPLLSGDPSRTFFVTFQVMTGILLLISFLLLQGRKWMLRLLCIPGIVMVLELRHLFEALMIHSYYPGSLTALFFPIVAFLYWKELLREFGN